MRMQIRALAALFLVSLVIFSASFTGAELALLGFIGLGAFALAGVVETWLNGPAPFRR